MGKVPLEVEGPSDNLQFNESSDIAVDSFETRSDKVVMDDQEKCVESIQTSIEKEDIADTIIQSAENSTETISFNETEWGILTIASQRANLTPDFLARTIKQIKANFFDPLKEQWEIFQLVNLIHENRNSSSSEKSSSIDAELSSDPAVTSIPDTENGKK